MTARAWTPQEEAYRRRTREAILPIDLIRKVADFILNGSFRMGDRMRAVNFGRANLFVTVIEPAEYCLAIRQGYKTYHEDLSIVKSTEAKQKELERGDYLEITPVRNLRRQISLTVLYPFGEGGTIPGIEKVGCNDRPYRNGTFFCNHQSSS